MSILTASRIAITAKTNDSATATAAESLCTLAPRPTRRYEDTAMTARNRNAQVSTAYEASTPVDISPEAKSTTCASSGISPRASRLAPDHAIIAAQSPRGNATVSIAETTAAADA